MFKLFKHNLRKLGTLLVAVVLFAFGIATPAQADITSFSTQVLSSMVKVNYVYTAPNPAAQGLLTITSSTNSELVWIIGAPSAFLSTSSGAFFVDPQDLVRTTNAACSPGPCASTLISSPAIYTTSAGKSFLPNGVYTTQLSFLNSMGSITTSTNSSFTVSVHAAPPTIVTATATALTTSRFTFRFPQSVKATPVADRANLTLTGQGSCSSSQATVTFANPIANFDNWVEINFLTQGSSSNISHVTTGFETLVSGCQYAAELRYKDNSSRPPYPTDINSPTWASTSMSFNAPTVPDAPTTPIFTANGATGLNAAWTAPAFDGLSAITRYQIRITPDSATSSIINCTSATNCDVTGLSPDQPYTFEIRAQNAVGDGSWLAAGSVTLDHCDYAPGNWINWSGCGKPMGNYTGVNFLGSNLSNADLSHSNFTNASLDYVNLSGSNLSGVNFTGATGSNITIDNATTLPPDWVIHSGTLGTIPSAPQNISLERGDERIRLSWDAPATNGGLEVSAYEFSDANGAVTCTPITDTSCEVSGLTRGNDYNISVRARNAAGLGAAASTGATTAISAASAPRNVSVTSGNQLLTISWGAPADNGGASISNYRVTLTPGGHTCSGSNSACVITGLTNGTAYQVAVEALNEAGYGEVATISNRVPYSTPNAPISVTATPLARGAQVSWVADSDNGSSITSYTAYSVPARSSCVSTTTTCQMVNLLPGVNYAFKVVATNAAGGSQESYASSPVKVLDLPTAPTVFKVAAKKSAATFTWTKSKATGGSPILRYTVTVLPGNKTCISTTTTCTVKGLVKKKKYTASLKVQTALGSATTKTKITFVGK